MFTLIKDGEVYGPEALGRVDVLVGGGKIVRVGKVDRGALEGTGLGVEVVEAEGCMVLPGFIDPHQHILGAGGEAGPQTRMREIELRDIVRAGITTVVGLLGTDGSTRHLTSLLAKARALEIGDQGSGVGDQGTGGVSTWIYTGNFQVPTVTFTGSVRDDVVVIDKVIGVGEIAIADYRSSKPSVRELARIVSEAMVGGMMAGKAGVTHFHTGAGKERLGILHRMLDEYEEIPAHLIHATHITRSKELIEDAVRLAKRGAYVDMDTIDDDFGESYLHYRESGGPLDRLTASSDGGAGTSKGVHTLWDAFVRGVRDFGLPVEEILPFWTSNTAAVLKLGSKGRIGEGMDGDLVVVGKEDMGIRGVFASGLSYSPKT